MSSSTSKYSYRDHKYSGKRKSRARVRPGFKCYHHGEDLSYEVIWRKKSKVNSSEDAMNKDMPCSSCYVTEVYVPPYKMSRLWGEGFFCQNFGNFISVASAVFTVDTMNRIKFKLNGVEHSVGCEVSSDTSLVDYIRERAELRGTKYMCREGGCGACVVTARTKEGGTPLAVNSCLVSVASCQDWDITTVEAVGNKMAGYNAIQTTLAEKTGTQCGHCTPGWVMSMNSLLKSNKSMTMAEIESSFGSNICRCTGYRPILDAFKKFAIDSPNRCELEITDIEDVMSNCKMNCKTDCENEEWCFLSVEDIKGIIKFTLKDGKRWYKVNTIDEIMILFQEKDYNSSYMLINGNTAKGVYPIDEYPDMLIDISGVHELKGYKIGQNVTIGAGNTLTEYLDILEQVATGDFEYLKKFHTHLLDVAHIAVRNIGTIGGNLHVKNTHHDFPSDVFLLLEAVGADVTLITPTRSKIIVTMQEFLAKDLTHMLIYNIILPPFSANHKLATFKVAARSQSSRAIVNGAFMYKLNDDNKVLEARIVYGGLSKTFIRATETEKAMVGKKLFLNDAVQKGLEALGREAHAVEDPPNPSPKYRKQLALALFYKGILSLSPAQLVSPRYQSGSIKLHTTRPVSRAQQTYDTDSSLWPLTEPVQKLEALIQCSGEAPYTEDLPALPGEVFADFVLSTVALGTIVSIDSEKALKFPGVIAFYTAKDIPGINSFIPKGFLMFIENEEVFCSGEVKYFNQPIGLIVAESRTIAEKAAKMVKVVYNDIKEPVVDIKVAKTDSKRNTLFNSVDATDKGTDVEKIIQGSNTMYGQYHFTMETMVCVTKPIEEGLEVHASTQHLDGVQAVISRALKMEQNRIDVITRRVGGAFGLKVSRGNLGAVACSLVSKLLNRPCRIIQPMTTNMRASGKRCPCHVNFEAAVDKSGVIQYVNYNMYEDTGYTKSEGLTSLVVGMYNNCYDPKRWNFKVYDTITDTAKNTWCRSPGTFEGISMAEFLMERISYELALDPMEVRLANLGDKYAKDIKEIVDTLKTNAQYNERKENVERFNRENRWKKRGLRGTVMRWDPFETVIALDVNLSVYQGDGTVVITHSGIEMGQGINTKAAQIAAYLLKLPMEKIQIKGNNTVFCPNAQISAASMTSQFVGIGVKRCCEELNKRLEPIRQSLPSTATWEEICSTAYSKLVDLQAHGSMLATDLRAYTIYSAAFAEVEIDVLTGEHEILRVDILQDAGQSVNPMLDLGQIEGAFVMGQGFWTIEKLVYSDKGEILTNRPWNYLVPQAKDIPQDFRVYFRKNTYSDDLYFGAKATAESPLCLTCVIPFAMREAIASARVDAAIPTTDWFPIDGPYTSEQICLSSATKTEDFKLM